VILNPSKLFKTVVCHLLLTCLRNKQSDCKKNINFYYFVGCYDDFLSLLEKRFKIIRIAGF